MCRTLTVSIAAGIPRDVATPEMAALGIIPVPHSDSRKGGPISFSCRTSRVVSAVTPAAHARTGLSKRLPFHHSG